MYLKYVTQNVEAEKKGMIEIGKKADLVVLDRDLYEVPVAEIKDAKVEMTLVSGNIVYSK